MVECVAVEAKKAGEAIKLLRKLSLLDTNYKTVKEGGLVYIPVSVSSEAVKALREHGISSKACEAKFPRRKRPKSLAEAGVKGISGYHLIGDLAVFSKRAEGPGIDEYKEAAKVLVEEMSNVRGVWLKEITEGEWRVQRLIHLAGEKRTWTIHKEFGLEFEVDIARVYFNPRLANEHRVIAEYVSNGERVLDMFSGVGGFTVHIAALREASIVASDINPSAVMYLTRNLRRNKRRLKGKVNVLWADASLLPEVLDRAFTRIIMNHPTASRWFAWAACRLVRPSGTIHYYTVTLSCLEAVDEALEAFSRCCRVEDEGCRLVLDYAPGVGVYRVDVKVLEVKRS